VAAGLVAGAACAGTADVYYVSLSGGDLPPYTNWATASRSVDAAVQQACLAPAPGGQPVVLVSNGVYAGSAHTADSEGVQITRPIAVRSLGGPGGTIIDGQGVRRAFAVRAGGFVLDGFTLRNCAAPGGGSSWDSGYGGALVAWTNCTVQHCIVTNCYALQSGGGLVLGGYNAQPSWLRNCLVTGNRAQVGPGGGLRASCEPVLYVQNCTIVGNDVVSGSQPGGGIWHGIERCNTIVQNSIVYGNSGKTSEDNNYVDDGNPNSDLSFYHCCAYPMPLLGTNNTRCLPEFIRAINLGTLFTGITRVLDPRLRQFSPCVDTGTNQAWMAGTTDLAGGPRVAHGVVDMGAYERTGRAGLGRVSNVSLEGDTVTLGLTNLAAHTSNGIERAASLTAPDPWRPVGGVTTALAVTNWSDPGTSSWDKAFYRVRSVPRPWRWPSNAAAAVSLTYDDACNSHLDHAMPDLEGRGLWGTFYVHVAAVIANGRPAEWEQAFLRGHEIGNHSWKHPCYGSSWTPGLETYSAGEIVEDISNAWQWLEANVGADPARTFAYPCVDTAYGDPPEDEAYVGIVQDLHAAARIGGDEPNDPWTADLYFLRSYDLNVWDGKTHEPSFAELVSFCEEAGESGGWAVFMFHDIGGPPGSLNTSREVHQQFLDYLVAEGYWVAPVQDVVPYIREKRTAAGIADL